MNRQCTSPTLRSVHVCRAFLLVVFTLCSLNLSAQQLDDFGREDTSRSDSLPLDTERKARQYFLNKDVSYTIGFDDWRRYAVDTLVDAIQIYDPAMQANYGFRNNGNLGGATAPLTFQPKLRMGFDLGFHQFDLYQFTPENLPHYNSKGPYSEMYFQLGTKKEQQFKVRHFQPLGEIGKFSFHYNRINSLGYYQRQLNQHNNVAVELALFSRNQRYRIQINTFLNTLQAQENGGTVTANIFAQDNEVLERQELVDVQLDNAFNDYRTRAINIEQELRFGRTVTVEVDDSTDRKMVQPEITLYHRMELTNDKYLYTDTQPDSAAYDLLWDDESLDIEHATRLRQLGNVVGVKYRPIKSADSSGTVFRNLVIDASATYEVNELIQDSVTFRPQRFQTDIQLTNNPETKSKWRYKALASYSFLDQNKGDVLLSGDLLYDMGKPGIIGSTVSFASLQPDWIYLRYQNAASAWQNNFDKETSFTAGLDYTLPLQRFKVGVFYTAVSGFLSFNDRYLPQQYTGNTLQGFIVELQKDFRLKGFGWNNFFRIQWLSDKEYLRFPTYYSKHTLFYELPVFKKKLFVRFGIDMTYNTNYFAPGYQSLTGQFYLQEELQQKFYPVIDVFISSQVKTVTFYLKMDHVNQGMFSENGYYNQYRFPGLERSFKFGLNWKFFN